MDLVTTRLETDRPVSYEAAEIAQIRGESLN